VIRPLAESDVTAATAVYNYYVATSTATFATDSLTPEEWRADVGGTDPRRHGVWALGEPFAGYLVVAPFKGRCAYQHTAEVTVYLDPARTGQGLGRAAVTFAEDHARAAGLHALMAVICAENTTSLALFGRAGYAEVGRLREVGRKFDRWLDVVYLEKVIRSEP
jgi:phosphinothricin acetyltransferase